MQPRLPSRRTRTTGHSSHWLCFPGSREKDVHLLTSCRLPHSTTSSADTISGQATAVGEQRSLRGCLCSSNGLPLQESHKRIHPAREGGVREARGWRSSRRSLEGLRLACGQQQRELLGDFKDCAEKTNTNVQCQHLFPLMLENYLRVLE